MASNRIRSLWYALAEKYQKLEIKKVVLELCVFRVLLHGTQTWSLKEKDKKMLQIANRKWERIPPVVWSDSDEC